MIGWWTFGHGARAMIRVGLILLCTALAAAQHTATTAQDYAERARELIGQADAPSAERELRKAVELAPDNTEYLALLGAALGMQHKLQESDQFFEKALRIDPHDTATRVPVELTELQLAETLFQSIWTSYPDTAKLGYALARVQYRAGKYSDSIATLRRTIATHQESSEIHNLLGWCLFKTDDLKGAVAALDRAIALDAGDESNYLDVGMMLLAGQHYEGAMAAAEKEIGRAHV